MPTLRIQGPVPAEAPGPLRLGEAEIFIGRAPTCEVQIKDNQASRKHCRVYPEGEERWCCEDLQSRNGTLLNGVELKAQSELRNGDVITIGDHSITFDTGKPKAPPPPALSGGGSDGNPDQVKNPSYEPFANEAPFGAPGTVYVLHFTGRAGEFAKVLEAPITTVGRGEDADIVIKEPLASRVHAQFEVKMTGLKLVDLESRNGTKVNGENANQKSLERRDVIEIGETFIRVSARPPLTTSEMAAPDLDKILGRKGANETEDPAENATIDEGPKAGAKPAAMPRLRYSDEGDDRVYIINVAETIIGRSEKATVTLKEKLSSREHCKVILNDDGSYNLVDLGSRNGTKLNGRDVKGSIQILTGDVFSIGDTAITFEIPSDPAGGGGGDAGAGGPIGGSGGGGVVVTGPTAPVARRSTVPPAVTAPGGIDSAQSEGPPGGGGVVTAEPQAAAAPIAPRRRTSAAGANESSPVTTIMTALVIVVVLVVAAVILTNVDLGSGPSSTNDNDDGGNVAGNNQPRVNVTGSGTNNTRNNASRNNNTDNAPLPNNAAGNNEVPSAIAALQAQLAQLTFDERYGEAYQVCLDFIRDNQLDPDLTSAARTELEEVQSEAWDVYDRRYGSMDPASMSDEEKAQALAEIRTSFSNIDRIIQDAARRFGG